MKNLLILISFISLSHAANADKKVYAPIKDVPIELDKAIRSIQEINLTGGHEAKNFQKTLRDVDNTLSLLTRDQALLITKTIFYKEILRRPPIKEGVIEIGKDGYEAYKKSVQHKDLDPFSLWLKGAIEADLDEIYGSRVYQSYIAAKKKKGSLTVDLLKLKKKISLLLPWYEFLVTRNTDDIEKHVKNFLNAILKEFISLGTYLANNTRIDRPEVKPSKDLLFFKLTKVAPAQKRSETEKSLDDILAPIIEKHKKEGLPLPVNDWIPDEDDFAEKLSPLDVPEPDPDYVAPKELPEPTDDWVLDL